MAQWLPVSLGNPVFWLENGQWLVINTDEFIPILPSSSKLVHTRGLLFSGVDL